MLYSTHCELYESGLYTKTKPDKCDPSNYYNSILYNKLLYDSKLYTKKCECESGRTFVPTNSYILGSLRAYNIDFNIDFDPATSEGFTLNWRVRMDPTVGNWVVLWNGSAAYNRSFFVTLTKWFGVPGHTMQGMIVDWAWRMYRPGNGYVFNYGQTYLVTIRWDPSANNMDFMIDGVVEHSSTPNFTATTNAGFPQDMTIGVYPFGAYVNDISVYNKYLPNVRVQSLVDKNYQHLTVTDKDGLVHYWNIFDSEDNIVFPNSHNPAYPLYRIA